MEEEASRVGVNSLMGVTVMNTESLALSPELSTHCIDNI